MLLLRAKLLLAKELAGLAVALALEILADPELIVGALSLFAIPVKV